VKEKKPAEAGFPKGTEDYFGSLSISALTHLSLESNGWVLHFSTAASLAALLGPEYAGAVGAGLPQALMPMVAANTTNSKECFMVDSYCDE
jgi:hypothetical protein